MRRVTGDIGAGLLGGRIDITVRRAEGEEIAWEGVVLLDDQAQPIDFWQKALAYVQWRNLIREKVGKMTDRDALMFALSGERPEDYAPRIGVLEFWRERGGSRTVYIEPGDTVVSYVKHERR